MSKKNTIDEYALRQLLRCPLAEAAPALEPPKWDAVVTPVLQSVLLDAFDEHRLTRRDIRALLEDKIKSCFTMPQEPDWNRVVPIAARLDELVRGFKVLMPVTSYRYGVEGGEILGRYAVLRRMGRKGTLVLRVRGLEREHQSFKPAMRYAADIVSYCRLAHLTRFEPTMAPFDVVNFHVSRDAEWTDHLDPEDVHHCIQDAALVWRKALRYPVPGRHCQECAQLGCGIRQTSAG